MSIGMCGEAVVRRQLLTLHGVVPERRKTPEHDWSGLTLGPILFSADDPVVLGMRADLEPDKPVRGADSLDAVNGPIQFSPGSSHDHRDGTPNERTPRA